jgi:DNA-binding GntR family transcriptional regulator
MIMVDPRRYRQIYAELSARIAGGAYPPGSPLPPIGRLADEFEVSRDTVQRAIGKLSDEGKVTRWPGLGWYVSEAKTKG